MRSAKLLGYLGLLLALLVGFAIGTCVAKASTCISGGDLQEALNARGPGATVCLQGSFSGTIRPLRGQTVVGGVLRGGYDLRAGNVTLRGTEIYGSDIGVVMGDHATVTDAYIHDESQNGIHAYAGGKDWWLTITDSTITHNGSRSLEGHSSAGVKLMELSRTTHTLGAGATVTGNTISDNFGNGLWFDRSSNAVIAEHNVTNHNTRHGIRCEICGGPVRISDNTAVGNGYDGIDLTSVGLATLTGNTAYGNDGMNITVHKDPRAVKRYPDNGDPTKGWRDGRVITSGNRVRR